MISIAQLFFLPENRFMETKNLIHLLLRLSGQGFNYIGRQSWARLSLGRLSTRALRGRSWLQTTRRIDGKWLLIN